MNRRNGEIWTVDYIHKMADAFSDIPVVDLTPMRGSPDERAELADSLRGICHEIGFFIIENHGISSSFLDDLFSLMHQFFSLSDEQKGLIDKRKSRHFRGWESVGTEFTNNLPDIREQIDLWSEWPTRAEDVEPAPLRLLGPNQRLPEEVLPGYQALVDSWFAKLSSLANQLLGLLSLGLGLSEDHLERYFGDEPMSLTKLIHYPPTPSGGAGVNPHHDTGFITILAPGSTPGLQVQNQDGAWIDVPIFPGTFVVNLGELLQSMTGNYFVATPHRVVTNAERYSAGYFHGPSLDAPLAPLSLDPSFAAAVAESPRHSSAGFMAQAEETEAGVAAMASPHSPDTYGDQLWNYFTRSYPDQMASLSE